jgi:hypothetical protein
MKFFFKVLDHAFFFNSVTTKGVNLVPENDPGRDERLFDGDEETHNHRR